MLFKILTGYKSDGGGVLFLMETIVNGVGLLISVEFQESMERCRRGRRCP